MTASRRHELKQAGEPLECKLVSQPFTIAPDDQGIIEGYGAVFNDPHPTSSWLLDADWSDVIAPGAFKRTLAEHKARGTLPAMLFMHERGNIPGVWREAKEDSKGLQLAGQLSLSALGPSGAPLFELCKMGAVSGLSIGFKATKVSLDEKAQVRTLLDVDLGEVSLVDIPGGPSARITDVKGAAQPSARFLEGVLRRSGLSKKEAKAVLGEGLKAIGLEVEPAGASVVDPKAEGLGSLVELLNGLAARMRS